MNIRQVTEPAGNPGYAGPALQTSALALPPMVSIAIVVMAKMLFMLFMLNTPIVKQHIRNVRVFELLISARLANSRLVCNG